MILFFPGPQNFVLSFMDKPPLPILMRWIFGPPGRADSRPFSGFVYHKFWQNFWLGPPEVAIEQSKGRAEPTQDSSMSKQTTKLLFLEPTALWKLWPQWVTVPFHNNIVIFSNIFVLSLCYYFEHRPWIVWPCFTNLYKLYFSLIILCQVNKFRKSTMAMAWVKRQDFTGCPIRCFNVVIGTLSLNNSFCSFSIFVWL